MEEEKQAASIREMLEDRIKSLKQEDIKGWDRTIQITLTGEGGGDYYIVTKGGTAVLYDGFSENPDLRLKTTKRVLVDIYEGRLSGIKALLTKKIEAHGSIRDKFKLRKLM